jgi:hypothetical protein
MNPMPAKQAAQSVPGFSTCASQQAQSGGSARSNAAPAIFNSQGPNSWGEGYFMVLS